VAVIHRLALAFVGLNRQLPSFTAAFGLIRPQPSFTAPDY